MKTLVLIDSNAIVHRAYHALPKTLSNSKGELTNVTYGFALALIKILEELKPDYLAAAFDLAGPTFRHIEYKEYKATRVKADQELYDQIPHVKEILEAFKIPIYAVEGFEADDVIGTIVEQCASQKRMTNKRINEETNNSTLPTTNNSFLGSFEHSSSISGGSLMIYIATGDKDVYQLLNGNVKVLMLKKGFSQSEIFDRYHLKERYNLDPEDFIDLKALMGDASDNIPGVPGIGPKTATELIIKFDTLEKLYKKIAKLLNCSIAEITIQQFNNEIIGKIVREMDIKERIVKLLIENKDQAFQSQRLATIRRDVPIEFDLELAKWGRYDKEKLRALFEELGFKSLLERFSDKDRGQSRHNIGTVPSVPSAEQRKKDNQLRLEL